MTWLIYDYESHINFTIQPCSSTTVFPRSLKGHSHFLISISLLTKSFFLHLYSPLLSQSINTNEVLPLLPVCVRPYNDRHKSIFMSNGSSLLQNIISGTKHLQRNPNNFSFLQHIHYIKSLTIISITT